jgi:two-component system OmpR family response regulator
MQGNGHTDTPARVLVVDDEDSITQLVSTVLRYEGFEVETAHDGRTAVKRAASFDPDLSSWT